VLIAVGGVLVVEDHGTLFVVPSPRLGIHGVLVSAIRMAKSSGGASVDFFGGGGGGKTESM
jgi:hypothetical protein